VLAYINDLVNTLAEFHPVSQDVKRYLQKHCKVKKLSKGGYLVKPGEISRTIFFIHRGVLRSFVRAGEKEITSWISSDRAFVAPINSLLACRPSVEYIQALRETVLLELDAALVDALFDQYPEFNIVARKLITRYYQDAEMRSYMLRIASVEARCRFFLHNYPDKALIVPKKYIASFVGIRKETLSRTLKKIEKNNG